MLTLLQNDMVAGSPFLEFERSSSDRSAVEIPVLHVFDIAGCGARDDPGELIR